MKILSAGFSLAAHIQKDFPRDGLPEVAILGRSNVGKSSLLNAILGKELARTSSTPGRTQSVNFYLVNKALYLVDLPGYGYAHIPKKIKRQLAPLSEGYLTARHQLRGVIHLIDLRHPPTALDIQLQDWLKANDLPSQVVGTKADKVSRNKWLVQTRECINVLGIEDENIILSSAITGQGIRDILHYVTHCCFLT